MGSNVFAQVATEWEKGRGADDVDLSGMARRPTPRMLRPEGERGLDVVAVDPQDRAADVPSPLIRVAPDRAAMVA